MNDFTNNTNICFMTYEQSFGLFCTILNSPKGFQLVHILQ